MGHLSEVWPRHSQTCHRPTRKSLGHNLSQRRAGANIEEEAWHQYRHSSHMFVGCFCSVFHVSGTSADSVVRLLGCKQYPDHGPDLFCAPLVRSLTHCCSMIQRREILSCSALKHWILKYTVLKHTKETSMISDSQGRSWSASASTRAYGIGGNKNVW